ncbi:MAG: Sec-independent protein translocase protein TatB [Candidatus Accumulibacter appositus]|uniref:Sec-independent protein translocase protein TatB n=1 Tax=Candidatus Accumulibacter appositus TaxID=1454003 RepID=A0A011QGB1_9PROT|nr:Sec-independent protein translocase protein TatB [Accumulibacter sp.]EXI77859.1 MAG: Sec-independent protein translocase protein TatB [Candidatus Accumulibacter appositus]HRF05764.1 Sec-independent protein translocase protein TatB [Accumulibacter sp.]
MFDISFTEMMLIAVVALVVIGPERLPKVARAAGHLLGRAQRYVSDVKSDINREIQLDELKKLRTEIQDSARSVEQSLNSEVQAARQAMTHAAQAAKGDANTPAANASPSIAPTEPTQAAIASTAATAPNTPGSPEKPAGTV